MANRARLLMEVVEAVSEIWGPDRVGVRLSVNRRPTWTPPNCAPNR